MSDERAVKVIKVRARDLKMGDIYRRISGPASYNRNWRQVREVREMDSGSIYVNGLPGSNSTSFNAVDLVEVQVGE